MFTGIIEATARVISRTDTGIILERPALFDDLRIGSSIAVSGVCLSMTHFDDRSMTFDIVPVTFSKTKLGMLKPGDVVNLERAMKADGRLEGHIVTGHVEGVGRVERAPAKELTLSLEDHLLSSVVAQGSIAIDGVSLTVASVEAPRVTVALIPHTLASTTLGRLAPNDPVNIETDILARYATSSLHGHLQNPDTRRRNR